MTNNIARNNLWQRLLIISVLCLFTLAAQAVIPDKVNYQGYLTDSGGSPINGTVSITFSLYNIESGGISLWTDTQSVSVANGLFSVQMGGAGNPFPLGLFDDPLWLGLNVAADGEMSPRIALTSTAFSFKADDALTLQGQSAASYDQSAHLSDGANPHGVSAAQAGAVSSANFLLHTADPAAHHTKTSSFTELLDSATDAQIPDNISIKEAKNALYLDGLKATDFGSATQQNTNTADIAALQSAITALQSQLVLLQSENTALQAKLQYVTVIGTDMYIDGTNLHIRSGSGSTDALVNGLGNLIVGYNELSGAEDHSGSHNLILGKFHGYSSYGGLVAGLASTISAPYASVTGGYSNTASGAFSSVSGGTGNTASGIYSSASGGQNNAAADFGASISGGANNTVTGTNASVSGGTGNNAAGVFSSISGGENNASSGRLSSISGGRDNIALGETSSVSGGRGNTASGYSSTVSGGNLNSSTGFYSSVSGGYNNTATYNNASVSGGAYNNASGLSSSVSGGSTNTASITFASVSGGGNNTASGTFSAVTGGRHNEASGSYAFVAGGGRALASEGNKAFANYSTVVGGLYNWAGDPLLVDHTIGEHSSISGGYLNKASGFAASVSGGFGNRASGSFSSISGGGNDSVSGDFDWRAGDTFFADQ